MVLYECVDCNKKFTEKFNYSRHINRKNKCTNETQYKKKKLRAIQKEKDRKNIISIEIQKAIEEKNKEIESLKIDKIRAFEEFDLKQIEKVKKKREHGEILISLEINGMNLALNFNTDDIESFYKDNNIYEFIGLNVVYIGVIGKYDGGYLLKFSLSKKIFEREYNQHKKVFGEQFKIIFVVQSDNNIVIEELFKKTIKSKKINIKINFSGKNRDELFTTTDDFTINDAKELMKKIVHTHPLKILKEKDEKIKELESKNDNEIIIEKEKTKQKELEKEKCIEIEKEKTKQLELQFKILKLKKDNNELSQNVKLNAQKMN
jgi:hypothetical protein